MLSPPSPHNPWLAELLAQSYKTATGTPLIPDGMPGAKAARWLYRAPFCLLAQDAAADPCFVYANLAAQDCFGYGWQEFTGMPSRLSAGAGEEREQRQRFMDSVRTHGHVSGYRGRRVAKSGRHFWIEDTTVWNLTDAMGTVHGQAAMFHKWSYEKHARTGREVR